MLRSIVLFCRVEVFLINEQWIYILSRKGINKGEMAVPKFSGKRFGLMRPNLVSSVLEGPRGAP